jgi:hypothetical protein
MTHQENQILKDIGLTPVQIARTKKALKGFSIVTSNGTTVTASIPLPGTAKYLLGIKTINTTTAKAIANNFDAVLNNEKVVDNINCGFTEATYGGNGNNEGYLETFRTLTGKDVLNVAVTATGAGADTIFFIVYYAL